MAPWVQISLRFPDPTFRSSVAPPRKSHVKWMGKLRLCGRNEFEVSKIAEWRPDLRSVGRFRIRPSVRPQRPLEGPMLSEWAIWSEKNTKCFVQNRSRGIKAGARFRPFWVEWWYFVRKKFLFWFKVTRVQFKAPAEGRSRTSATNIFGGLDTQRASLPGLGSELGCGTGLQVSLSKISHVELS